ncbi:helix-turn-helix domain-containing protein [Streptomyces spinosirectus]
MRCWGSSSAARTGGASTRAPNSGRRGRPSPPRRTPTPAPECSAGSPRQPRIARSVAQGATNREGARQLSISRRTVEYHLCNLFTRLGVGSQVTLTRFLGD